MITLISKYVHPLVVQPTLLTVLVSVVASKPFDLLNLSI